MSLKNILITILLIVCFGQFLKSQTVEIHQIDVGTGDATLINIRNDNATIATSILIDAGKTNMDESVISFLNSNAKKAGGKVYLDYVITSHYHEDHIGGYVGHKETLYQYSGLKRRICGERYTGVLGDTLYFYAVLDKGESQPTSDSKLFDNYKNLCGPRRIAVGETTVGNPGAINSISAPIGSPTPPPNPDVTQKLSLGGYIDLGTDIHGVPIHLRLVLADAKVYCPNAPTHSFDVAASLGISRYSRINPNNWGLGWVLEYGAFRYYTAGDVGGYNNGYLTCTSCGTSYFDIETPLANTFMQIYQQPVNGAGHICAQKISHHGSCCSNNDNLIQIMKPTVAIISAGTHSGFGHPTQEVLTRFESETWNVDSLRYHNLMNYYLTELFFPDREIDLTKGSTAGNPSRNNLIATDQPVNIGDIFQTEKMLNGGFLYYMKPTLPLFYGDISISVYPENDTHVRISQQSSFKVKYDKYDGTALEKTYNCHGQ
jgi:hypothetical protein